MKAKLWKDSVTPEDRRDDYTMTHNTGTGRDLWRPWSVSQSHCEIAPASNFALLFHKETHIFTLTLTLTL